MGWTETYKTRGMSMDEFFEKEIGFNFVSKGALVNFSEYYRAFEWEPEKNGKKMYGVLVCHVHLSRGRYFNIAFKDMTSDMGPYLHNCPERILKIVEQTEPCNEWEKEWREKCWKVIEQRKAAKELKDGDIIKFDTTFEFTNGSVCDTFCVRECKGLKRLWMYKNGMIVSWVRIRGWRGMNFEILGNVNDKAVA